MSERPGTDPAAALTRVLGFAILLGLLAVASSAAAETQAGDLGTFQWPAEEHWDFAALADLGASVYADGTEPTRLGLHQFEGMRLERVNDTATRIRVDETEGRTTSIVQPHQPREAGGREDVDVRPAQLRPVVETHLDEERHSIYVLKMWGPPGSFDLGNGSAEERTRTLANRLGFPLEEVHDETKASFPYLYGGHHRGCYEVSGGDCVADADIRIDCDACREFSWVGPDRPSGALDSRFRGLGFALFDEEVRLVAASVSYVFDLNESAVLNRSEARDRAAEGLRERGYEITHMPDRSEMTVRTYLAPTRVEMEEVRYEWRFLVAANASAEGGGTTPPEPFAEVDQDPATGRILSIDYRLSEVSNGVGPWWAVPGPGALGLFTLAGAAVIVGRWRTD